ncbi:MAG: hypothetical protein K2M05_02325 [Paramuribaculum sp.]|nr:hypothetical protein [Paramuribaculum sp.]MDE6303868.1 hypothetical protein [Paramuribaculum sp.]
MAGVLIIADGMADDSAGIDGALASLSEAHTPAIDYIRTHGSTLRCYFINSGESVGSEYAIASILKSPVRLARGPLEALGLGLRFTDNYMAARVDRVDSACAKIPWGEDILSSLRKRGVESYPLATGGTLMIKPDDMPSLGDLLDELGVARSDFRIWGEGRCVIPEIISQRRGTVVAGLSLLKGLADVAGMDFIRPEGADGTITTDYAAKGRAAVSLLEKGEELVVVHIEAPDTASHLRCRDLKVEALSLIDRNIVGPLLNYALSCSQEVEIKVMSDHPASPVTGKHINGPVDCFTFNNMTKR